MVGDITLRTKGGDQLTAADKPGRVTNHDAAHGRRRVIGRESRYIHYAASPGVSHLYNAYRHSLIAPLSFVVGAHSCVARWPVANTARTSQTPAVPTHEQVMEHQNYLGMQLALAA